jgi:large subunit ribosomal protein L14e
MKGIEEGRVCVKIKGRDSGDKCVIVKVIDSHFVELVSKTRQKPRKVNVKHLELLNQVVDSNNESEMKKLFGE